MIKPFSLPDGDEATWSEIATKEFDANDKKHYALLLLAQRPITLVLMMINSCSYNSNDLVFIKFQI